MRASRFLIATLKETPADAEVISHQLMLRAGMIRKMASGLYNWLPMGLRVLKKVEQIVREEMDSTGAQELLMPVVQPAELWQESGRWEQYGPELLRIQDRHQRAFCLGPTHEEVITDLVRNEISSYRQLPANFYQIQTKFRDEIRPRFGIMRSREFLMKDAYSFHTSQDSLQQTYDAMHAAYTRIFSRMGLDFRAVLADTGSIGGNNSHEFHVLASSGEDAIAFSSASDYAANIEKAEALAPQEPRPQPGAEIQEVATPGQHSIEQVSAFLGIPSSRTVKTLLVMAETADDEDNSKKAVALVLRGDHELNTIKAEHLQGVRAPLTFASEALVESLCHCKPGSIGPKGLDIDIIVDRSAAVLADFVCGANREGYHLQHVNWERDLPLTRVEDIRNVVEGDPSPCGQGELVIRRGIEVGHIFQLGTKYSAALNATFLNEEGREQVMQMGCYGIGVSRVVAAAIEQNHDEKGIIWPEAIAPFTLALIPINIQKSEKVRAFCENLYHELSSNGVEVLFMDEEKARLGAMLADAELLGIPHRLVIGEKGLASNEVEYRHRRDSENTMLDSDTLLEALLAKLAKN